MKRTTSRNGHAPPPGFVFVCCQSECVRWTCIHLARWVTTTTCAFTHTERERCAHLRRHIGVLPFFFAFSTDSFSALNCGVLYIIAQSSTSTTMEHTKLTTTTVSPSPNAINRTHTLSLSLFHSQELTRAAARSSSRSSNSHSLAVYTGTERTNTTHTLSIPPPAPAPSLLHKIEYVERRASSSSKSSNRAVIRPERVGRAPRPAPRHLKFQVL